MWLLLIYTCARRVFKAKELKRNLCKSVCLSTGVSTAWETDSVISWPLGNGSSIAVSHGKALPSRTYLTQKYKTTGPDFLGKSCSSTRRSSWSQFKCPLAREETVLSPAPKRFLATYCNEVWDVRKDELKHMLFALGYCMIFGKHTGDVWGSEAISSWQHFSLGIEQLKFNLSGWKAGSTDQAGQPQMLWASPFYYNPQEQLYH